MMISLKSDSLSKNALKTEREGQEFLHKLRNLRRHLISLREMRVSVRLLKETRKTSFDVEITVKLLKKLLIIVISVN